MCFHKDCQLEPNATQFRYSVPAAIHQRCVLAFYQLRFKVHPSSIDRNRIKAGWDWFAIHRPR